MDFSDGETLTIVSPATLPAGYVFEAIIDGNTLSVKVPPGGVAEGDVIQIPMAFTKPHEKETKKSLKVTRGSDNSSSSANHNKWRHSLCSCFNIICSSFLFWVTLFLPCVTLGQLMQRMGMNSLGFRTKNNYKNTCMTVVVFAILINLIALNCIFYYVVTEDSLLLYIGGGVIFFGNLVNYYWRVRLRMEIRNKFELPGSSCCPILCKDCGYSSDLATSFFCSLCSLIQIGRHTHDERIFKYHANSHTGLRSDAPTIV